MIFSFLTKLSLGYLESLEESLSLVGTFIKDTTFLYVFFILLVFKYVVIQFALNK